MKDTKDTQDFQALLRESREAVDKAYSESQTQKEYLLAEHKTKVEALDKQMRAEAEKTAAKRRAEVYQSLTENILTVIEHVAGSVSSVGDITIALESLKNLTADLLIQHPEAPLIFIVQPTEYALKLTPEMMMHLKQFPEELSTLSPEIFEHLIGELLRHIGFEDVRLVGRDPSTAADVFAATRVAPIGLSLRVFVEVKRRKKRIGIEGINEVLGAMLSERPKHGWHVAVIASLSGFKSLRRETPEGLMLQGIELREGADITRWLHQYKLGDNGLWLADPKRHMPGKKPYNPGHQADG